MVTLGETCGEMTDKTLGQRIRSSRLAKGLEQKDIAAAIGVTSQSVSGWERDVATPAIDNLPALAECLGVEILWLLRGIGLRERTTNDSLNLSVALSPGGRSVPKLDMDSAALDFRAAIDTAKEYAPSRFTTDQEAFELTVLDESNAPDLMPGFKIIVSPNTLPLPGEMVFASIGPNKVPLIREMRRERDVASGSLKIILHPKNAAWEDYVLDPSTDEIIGMISEVSRRTRPSGR